MASKNSACITGDGHDSEGVKKPLGKLKTKDEFGHEFSLTMKWRDFQIFELKLNLIATELIRE